MEHETRVAEDTDRAEWQAALDHFRSLEPALANDDKLRGKYVAVDKHRLIDSDDDKFRLARRMAEQFPDRVVLIAKVGDEHVFEAPSPEILR